MMEIYRIILFAVFIISLLPALQCVTVTLENGIKNVNKSETQGNSVQLVCTVTGGGEPDSVEWTYHPTSLVGEQTILYYNKQLITANDRGGRITIVAPYHLKILNLEESDTGYYTCSGTIVTDTPGKDSKYYNFTVHVPPTPPVCGFPSDLAITLGQSSSFTCNSHGVPNPDYVWFKDGKQLNPDPKGIEAYANTSYTYNTVTGTLTFSSVVAGDAGTYYCMAKNIVGQDQCEARQITTKNVNVGRIVGIVFGVIFAILLLAVIIWWTWKRGYCDNVSGMFEGKEHDIDNSYDEEGGNDIVLDGAGPLVHKTPSENGKQEASMMI